MKAILTTIALLFFSTLAMAQNVSEEAKVETISFGITVEVEINEWATIPYILITDAL